MVELEKNFQTDRSTYLTFDVRKKKSKAYRSLPSIFYNDILINNANHG
jgi:NADP-dependent 3-hydroxy acid dehydrogenase YdfG